MRMGAELTEMTPSSAELTPSTAEMTPSSVELTPAFVAALDTLIHTHPAGYRGVLLGSVQESVERSSSDHSADLTTYKIIYSLTGCLAVEEEDHVFTGYQIDDLSLVRLVRRSLPDEWIQSGGVQTLGLVSYSPHINTPSYKDIQFTSQMHDLDKGKEKILLHVHGSSTVECLTYTTQIHVLNCAGSWEEVLEVSIPNLGQLAQPQYIRPQPTLTGISGEVGLEVEGMAALRLEHELREAKDIVERMADQLYTLYKAKLAMN